MKGPLSLALGILTSIGGFADMAGIIAASQAGAQFRFALLWTLVPGVVGLMVYSDMAGRVAIASGRTLFDAIRDRLGSRLALIPLFATLAVNTLTLVIELAGMALALQLATRLPYAVWIPLAGLLLGVVLWRASFSVLENGSTLLGLALLVTVVAAVKLAPPWREVGLGLVHPDVDSAQPLIRYLFLAISLLGAYMTPFEFYFYSSGAIEEEWDAKELLTNRVTALVGSGFGGVTILALMLGAGVVLFPQRADVKSLADAAGPIETSLGGTGLALFLLGTFGVSLGAGLENALSGAYSVCQCFGWDWGKKGRPREAPLFHLVYLTMLVVAVGLALSGLDPIGLATATMALAGATLPFTFVPLLIVANDADYMGQQRNTRSMNLVAWVVLGLLLVVTLATLPLLVLAGGGS